MKNEMLILVALMIFPVRAMVGLETLKNAGPEEQNIFERPIQWEGRWVRNQQNLIFNFRNMYQPCVVQVPDADYPYRVWFFGWALEDTNPDQPGCDAIYFGRSKNLSTWEIYCGPNCWDKTMDPSCWKPVLTASDRYYDAWHNGDPSVVFHEGRYFMAYSATSKPYVKQSHDHLEGMLLCIMGATSEDGIHWTKTNQPLLIESTTAQHAATTSEHACDFHRPSLMRDGGKWKLWFDYWSYPDGVCMGYAENDQAFEQPDGFKPVHDLRKPLIKNWTNPEVIKVDDKFYCFGDPPGYPPTDDTSDFSRMWSSRQLCEAESEDGLHWKIRGFIPPDSNTPACHVPQAFLTTLSGERRLYLFYATQRGGTPVYDYRYNAIRVLYRRVEK